MDTFTPTGEQEALTTMLALITQYTSEIEQYDRLSGTYAMTCIAFAGVVIGIVCTLIQAAHKVDCEFSLSGSAGRHAATAMDSQTKMAIIWRSAAYYRASSAIILLLPAVTTLCLYVFSSNCHKVAVYRGCMQALERAWNSLALEGNSLMAYNSVLLDEYFGSTGGTFSKWFVSNSLGGVVVVVYVLVILFASLGTSCAFARNARVLAASTLGRATRADRVLSLAHTIVAGTSLLGCALCCYDLLNNPKVTESVRDTYLVLMGIA